jgi:hypothetical protein
MYESFQEFVTASSSQIPITMFIINLISTAILALVLRVVYMRYGNSLSNRDQFSKNFFLIAMTTMLIISIVKSSLALSLGLVGALSIIRFRAAIKEPEELAYLFIAISLGLGFGADQGLITFIALIIIISILVILSSIDTDVIKSSNLLVTISSQNPENLKADLIINILSDHCSFIELKRLDEGKNFIEMSLLIEAASFPRIMDAKNEILAIEEDTKITFLDNIGIIN